MYTIAVITGIVAAMLSICSTVERQDLASANQSEAEIATPDRKKGRNVRQSLLTQNIAPQPTNIFHAKRFDTRSKIFE